MSEDTAPVAAAQPATTPKKKAKNTPKKAKAAPSHPKVSEMVIEAITTLKERGGSSLQAIKKHVLAHHKVDMERLTPFVKKYLKNAVASGTLVQTKGKGANGSFKLGTSGHKTKEPKKQVKKAKKDSSPKKKQTTPKKITKPKAKTEKKKSAAKKTPVKKASKPKTPKKTTATKVAKPKVKKSPKKVVNKKTTKK